MSTFPVSLSVDGRPVRTPRDRLLIHVLRELGVQVPTLCHDDRLTPYGGCRLCVVERCDGPGGLVPACSTKVQDGMVIRTSSPAVIASRQQQLQLLVLDHRMDCPVCDRRSDCRLQDLIAEIGVPGDILPFDQSPAERDSQSPVISRDPSKCVLCARCVRLCEEVQGEAALGFLGRGVGCRVAPFLEQPLDCEFCGQCVNACPVGALVARPYVSRTPVWRRDRVVTTCSFCACGCEIAVETHGRRLVRVTSDSSSLPNRGKLCVKGWLGLDVLASPERPHAPLLRRDQALVEVGWEEALATAADGLRRAAARGPVVVAGGGRLSCEDGYLLQVLAREVLRTPHVGIAPVGGVEALVSGVWDVFDRPCSTVGFDDLREADLIVVAGTDPARSHPLVKTEIVQAAVQRGVSVIVIDPFAGALERHASMTLRPAPGATGCFFTAVTARALELGPAGSRHVEHLPGFRRWRQSLDAWSSGAAVEATGVGASETETVAEALVAARRPILVVGTGLGAPGDESAVARSAAALIAVLGGAAGLMILGGRSNVQGLIDVGLHPRLLAGHRRPGQAVEIENLTGRATVSEEGRGILEWVAEMNREPAGLLLVGVDLFDLVPGGLDPRRLLEGAGFTVAVDGFRTRTSELADVVLPVAMLCERNGSITGADGVRRPLRRALEPPAGVLSDTQVLIELARRMGGALPHGEELQREIERVAAPAGARPQPRRLEPAPPPRLVPGRTGLVLDAGPQLFHSGSVTRHSALLQDLSPTVAVRINPADARGLGVSRGEVVKLSSDLGEILLRVRLDRTVRQGTVAAPWVGSREGASMLIGADGEVVSVKIRKA